MLYLFFQNDQLYGCALACTVIFTLIYSKLNIKSVKNKKNIFSLFGILLLYFITGITGVLFSFFLIFLTLLCIFIIPKKLLFNLLLQFF